MDAVDALKKHQIAEIKRWMLAIAKEFPADNMTRIIPGYGMRGRHMAATAVRNESVLVELAPGVSYRSSFVNGKWTRPDECGDSDWTRPVLHR